MKPVVEGAQPALSGALVLPLDYEHANESQCFITREYPVSFGHEAGTHFSDSTVRSGLAELLGVNSIKVSLHIPH